MHPRLEPLLQRTRRLVLPRLLPAAVWATDSAPVRTAVGSARVSAAVGHAVRLREELSFPHGFSTSRFSLDIDLEPTTETLDAFNDCVRRGIPLQAAQVNGKIVTPLRDVTTEIQEHERFAILGLMHRARELPEIPEELEALRLETSRIAWKAGIGSQLASVADQLQLRVDEQLDALTRPGPVRVK